MVEPGERGLERLAALERAAAEAPVDRETTAAGRVRLLEAARRIRAAPISGLTATRAVRGRVAAIAALAALLGAVVLAFVRYWETPLSYAVRGNTTSLANYVSARSDAPAAVSFSDGSNVVANPGTRLRIDGTTSNGARVLVERGEATASVRHRDRTSWAFVAGPFEVRVTGTKLTIAWDPDSERIDVTLHEGSVEIETPIGPSRYAVTAGHTFHASARDGVVKLEDEKKPEPGATRESVSTAPVELADSIAAEGAAGPRDTVATDGTAAPRDEVATDGAARPRDVATEGAGRSRDVAATDGTARSRAAAEGVAHPRDVAASDGTARSRAAAEGAAHPRDVAASDGTARPRDESAVEGTPKNVDAPGEPWPNRVRRGAFADVVAAARARGVDDCLAKCGSADLRALADAARYTGAPELATAALLTLRTRFKGSDEARTAAFLLGRTAESTGDLARADQWYKTYLSESPSGALAADALAGRMLAAERMGALSRAKELARDYATRYPDGAAVRAARKLAGPD